MLGWIFTQALTYGGAAAALVNPFAGFAVYVALAILKPETLWYWSVTPWHYGRIVGVALLVGWVLHGTGRWEFGRARGIVLAFTAYWVWSMICAAFAQDQDAAWAFVVVLTKTFLPFLAAITLVDSAQKLKRLAWVIVICYGYVAYEFNLSYYEGPNRLMLGGHGGTEEGGVAIAMVTTAPLAFFLGLGAQRNWQKALAFGAAILMIHIPMIAFVRSAMLALIVGVVVAYWLLPKNPKSYIALALLTVLALRLAGPAVRQEFMSSFADQETRDASAQSRFELWSALWDSTLKRPILGVGPHNFPVIVEEYGFPRGKHGHNLWLTLGAELGFPGAALLLSFYGLCIRRLWPLARGRPGAGDPWLRDAARMVITSLVVFTVCGCFVTMEGLELPYYICLIGAGVLKLSSIPEAASQAQYQLTSKLRPSLLASRRPAPATSRS